MDKQASFSLYSLIQDSGGADMTIYQTIWDADLSCNGIQAISVPEQKDYSTGFVLVDTTVCSPDHHIFKEVYIPEWKKRSYQLVEKLFDNYTINQRKREKQTRIEALEEAEFLNMAIQSLPLKIAKQYIEEKWDRKINQQQWYTFLYELWFRPFQFDGGIDLTGFEHVFIGEQKKRELVGHHFWYKYWLEDSADWNKQKKDLIELLEMDKLDSSYPVVITVGYRLQAYDYKNRRFIPISKKRSAFFVGLSAEGLLALGTVRALLEKDASEFFVVNNKTYKLEMYKSPDGKSIRTFYPRYVPSS